MEISAVILLCLILLKCSDKIEDHKSWKLTIYCISASYLIATPVALLILELFVPRAYLGGIPRTVAFFSSVLFVATIYFFIKSAISSKPSPSTVNNIPLRELDSQPSLKELSPYLELAQKSLRYRSDLSAVKHLDSQERLAWEQNAKFYTDKKLKEELNYTANSRLNHFGVFVLEAYERGLILRAENPNFNDSIELNPAANN